MKMKSESVFELKEYKCLVTHVERTKKTHLKQLMCDEGRCRGLLFSYNEMYLDISRQKMDLEGLKLLLDFAEKRSLRDKIAAMFRGDHVNSTEDRAAMHVALRSDKTEKIMVDKENVVPLVHNELEKIRNFSSALRSGEFRGSTGKAIKNIICIGIGGSYLGPEFVYEALKTEKSVSVEAGNRVLRFLSNVDPIDISRATKNLDAEETVAVVISKTFTTAETMLNAKSVKAWFVQKLKSDESCIAQHMVAVSTNLELTNKFGISPRNVFGFWNWVGGRFSVSSAVGILPLSLVFGYDVCAKFLKGMHAMDTHFKEAALNENLPVLSGLLSFYNSQFLNLNSVAVLPYSQALLKFPAHIQQLAMESNGKNCFLNGDFLPNDRVAGEIFFGEPGTNGQHSFFQLLHQGHKVQAEFIGFAQSQNSLKLPGESVSNHDELMANFFAQPDALAFGLDVDTLKQQQVAEKLLHHKCFEGDRPSTCVLLPYADAFNLGMLLALYEHRVAVEGFLLGINSFDQYGVELGKVLANSCRECIKDKRNKHENKQNLSFSTLKMIDTYIKLSS